MKYLSFTFDDGRKDTFDNAYRIMKEYNFCGTVYCTTGYIDNSWIPPLDWKSAGESLDIGDIQKMQENGWEIGIHGDKHVTEEKDWMIAKKKLHNMGVIRIDGGSLPNSIVDDEVIEDIKKNMRISYIRRGRACDTHNLKNRIIYITYRLFGIQKAYNCFNRCNCIYGKKMDCFNIPSVVVRFEDRVNNIIRFIDSLPDNTWVTFMFHSILDEQDLLYGSDPWNWGKIKFRQLCDNIYQKKENITVLPVVDMINNRSVYD